MLKINYYRRSSATIGEKFLAGAVAVALIALLIYAGFVVLRFLFRQGGWRSRSGFWLAVGTMLLVAGKVLDSAPAILADSAVSLLPLAKLYSASLEEGLETITPLILGWSVWIGQKEGSFLYSGVYSGVFGDRPRLNARVGGQRNHSLGQKAISGHPCSSSHAEVVQ
jgi:hypothetical protein